MKRYQRLSRRLIIASLVIALLGVAVSVGLTRSPSLAQGIPEVEWDKTFGGSDMADASQSGINLEIENASASGKAVLLFFYAEWCHFCQEEKPIIDELEQEYGEQIAVIRVDCEDNPEAREEFGVTGFPTMLVISGTDADGDYLYQQFAGFTDRETLKESLDYVITDSGRDGIGDVCDNCPTIANADQVDVVSCGDTITTDTTLTADLLNCPGDGLVIGADAITLDCAGHTVSAGQYHTCGVRTDGTLACRGYNGEGQAAVALAAGVVGQPPGAQAYDWSTVTVDAAGDVGWGNHIAVDANGDAMISYWDLTNRDLKFAICDRSESTNGNCDQTGDWSTVAVDAAGQVGKYPFIAVDGNGDPMISYQDYINRDLKFAICDRSESTNGNCDQTGDWSTVTVDADGEKGDCTAIAVDANGDPVISYMDRSPNYDLKFATCDRSESTNGNCDQTGDWSTVTVDAPGYQGWYTAIAVDLNGDPMISYHDDANRDLKFAICDRSESTNGNCDQTGDWSLATLEAEASVGLYYTGIAVDPNGDPMISYFDDTNKDLKFAVCDLSDSTNGNCDQTDDWRLATVDAEGNVGYTPSITVDVNGDPMISYHHYEPTYDLKFAICDLSDSTNGNCDQTDDWSTETVDVGGHVGWFTSIGVDANGNAMISYGDGTNDDLKFATAPVGTPADADGDGVPDGEDNCPDDFNPDQFESEQPPDEWGDICDPHTGGSSGVSDENGSIILSDETGDITFDGTTAEPYQTVTIEEDAGGIGTIQVTTRGKNRVSNKFDILSSGLLTGTVTKRTNFPEGCSQQQLDNLTVKKKPELDIPHTVIDTQPATAPYTQATITFDLVDDATFVVLTPADSDSDGVYDQYDLNEDGDFDDPGELDNCPNTPNPDQADSDGDGVGDVCEGVDGGEGCFIATAAYGTSTVEEIDTLRAFRDEVLLQNILGSQLVNFYYEVSPPVADFISENDVLRTLVRELLVEPVAWVVDAIGTLWRD